MSDFTLPRCERLRSMRAVRRMFDEGCGGFVYPFRYVYLSETCATTDASDAIPNASCELSDASDAISDASSELSDVPSANPDTETRPVEVMFSVPKRFHKRANKRNILKRRSREAYRLNRGALCATLVQKERTVQIAFIYSTKECHTYKTIEHAVQRILEQIGARI